MKIYGASGHGGVILDALLSGGIVVECFLDDAPKLEFQGLKVFTPSSIKENDNIVVAIGDNTIRKRVVSDLKNIRFISVIHPKAIIADNVVYGNGTVVMAGVVVNQGAKIGSHVILNTKSSVDHDCVIEDFVHVSPGVTLCGGISIGQGTHIGAGATVLPNIKIGENVIVGAGAVVTKDIPSESRVLGVPARLI
jgi:sugar O-acyltransferase (sialic acid O-acetyltransferase NeuD family)